MKLIITKEVHISPLCFTLLDESLFCVQATTRFNEQLNKNSQLKGEMHTLHIERAHFQQLQNRLNKVRGHIK